MLTSHRLNDPECPRTAAYLPRFERAPIPDPDRDDWTAWQMLLASRAQDTSAGTTSAIRVATTTGFGTVCSTLIALPSLAKAEQIANRRGYFLFASGPPDEVPFESVID